MIVTCPTCGKEREIHYYLTDLSVRCPSCANREPEHRRKISVARTGVHASEEVRIHRIELISLRNLVTNAW